MPKYKATVAWEDVFEDETSQNMRMVQGTDPEELIGQLMAYVLTGKLVSLEITLVK